MTDYEKALKNIIKFQKLGFSLNHYYENQYFLMFREQKNVRVYLNGKILIQNSSGKYEEFEAEND